MINDVTIFHKTTCSTSKKALQLLMENKVMPKIRLYVDEPPTQVELKALLKKLGLKAEDIVRKKEKLYKEEYAGKQLTQAEWIRVLSKNPILIERPIVIKGDKAVVGRPPEKVLEIL
ncbi:MAG: arsenate reductase (glutaredoxin) [Flavipsychrobacter sp.]